MIYLNAGEFRTPVTIERPVLSQDSGGFQSRNRYVKVASVRVKWTNVHGAEVWQAAAVQARKPATVLMRYRDDVDETCVIKKGTDRYEIVSMDNVQERDHIIELKVQLVKQSG